MTCEGHIFGQYIAMNCFQDIEAPADFTHIYLIVNLISFVFSLTLLVNINLNDIVLHSITHHLNICVLHSDIWLVIGGHNVFFSHSFCDFISVSKLSHNKTHQY